MSMSACWSVWRKIIKLGRRIPLHSFWRINLSQSPPLLGSLTSSIPLNCLMDLINMSCQWCIMLFPDVIKVITNPPPQFPMGLANIIPRAGAGGLVDNTHQTAVYESLIWNVSPVAALKKLLPLSMFLQKLQLPHLKHPWGFWWSNQVVGPLGLT